VHDRSQGEGGRGRLGKQKRERGAPYEVKSAHHVTRRAQHAEAHFLWGKAKWILSSGSGVCLTKHGCRPDKLPYRARTRPNAGITDRGWGKARSDHAGSRPSEREWKRPGSFICLYGGGGGGEGGVG